ncbi:MAG: hypothetical protein KC550_00755 [Nanoarchaeota archaeon]|nr:hypothetical protein [Nanoarchaeota archaeon]
MFNLNKINGRSQIGIFILIALMIIILLIFLIYYSNLEKESNIEDTKKTQNGETDSKLNALKDNVDFCLERQIKKALVISGAKGGFIYEQGEYYFPSVTTDHFYDPKLANMLNLDYSYLTGGVLVHSAYEVYTPNLNSTKSFFDVKSGENIIVYNHSIKGDFEKYILDEFLDCIMLEAVEIRGFNLTFENFTSSLDSQFIETQISNLGVDRIDLVRTESIIGKTGDRVITMVNGKERYGTIFSNDEDGKYSNVKFDENIFENFGNADINDLIIRNLNSSVSVEVDFKDDSVGARVFFPVSIENKGFNSFFRTSYQEVNVRFKKLLEFSKTLLEAKVKDRSLDYSDITVINKVLDDGNYYYRNSGDDLHETLKFYQTELYNSSKERAMYVYTIEDTSSKILGNPYIFNFAYDNNAPYIDKNKIDEDVRFKQDGNSFLYVSVVDAGLTLNLKNFISDKQFLDNFLSYFIPNHINKPSYEFRIEANGDVFFQSVNPGITSINIDLTDGETIKTENFIFVSGQLGNKNNEDAKFCYDFKSSKISASNNQNIIIFPTLNEYVYDNYAVVDGTGYHDTFTYNLYAEDAFLNSLIGKSLSYIPGGLSFKRSCYDIGDFVKLQYELRNAITGNLIAEAEVLNNHDDIDIPIPKVNYPVDVIVKLIDTYDDGVLGEPFEITIYPRKCLGPSNLAASLQAQVGSTVGSCCDLSKTPITSVPNLNMADVNNIRTSGKVIDADMYFMYNPMGNGNFFNSGINSFNVATQNLWGPQMSLNNPTSLFKGHGVATCDGTFPKWEDILKVSSIGPSVLNSKVYSYRAFNPREILLKGPGFNRMLPFSVSYANQNGVCEFAQLNFTNELQLDVDVNNDGTKSGNLGFQTAFVSLNPLTYNGPLPDTPDGNAAHVMCDEVNVNYVTTDTFPPYSWLKNPGVLGKGGVSASVAFSKGFCQVGVSNCGGKVASPGYKARNDAVSSCEDYYYNGVDIIKSNAPSSWMCASNKFSFISCKNIIDPTQTRVGTKIYDRKCSGGVDLLCTDGVTSNCQINCPAGFTYGPDC